KKTETSRFTLDMNENPTDSHSTGTSSTYALSGKEGEQTTGDVSKKGTPQEVLMKLISCKAQLIKNDADQKSYTGIDDAATAKNQAKTTAQEERDDDSFDTSDLIQMIRNKMRNMREKLKNGEVEEKFQIGGASYTIKEWNAMLDKYDSAQEAMKKAIKEEIERRIKEESESQLKEKAKELVL
ncbi:MAG TPA: hypothetical protein VHQ24_02290, partial [Lachnospiraceae bacterium]|nr:hypothetical protein [Lachnospiraceae bacterium]